jgi:multidrug resistance efflux pump
LDIAVNKQKKTLLKKIWPLAIVVAVIAIAIHFSAYLLQADFVIDNDTLVYGEVKQGPFSISVRGAGLLVPDKIKWLSASVDGHVERVVVKPGKAVKKGDLIIELSNPKLKQLQEETKWELEAIIAESKASQADQKSGLLFQKARMLDAKLNYESSKLKLDAQQELFNNKTGAVSKIDYEKTQLETKQFKQRWQIQEEVLHSMTENIVVQDNARKSRINKMQKTLERAEQQVKNLMVYASLDSVVQGVAVEPGQRINMGSNLAKLAQQDSLIAELQVAELLIGDVKVGQQVTIDTRNNKVAGIVSRVDPAVVNGNVQVDVSFIEELPSDARPDLSVDGEIKITDIADTLYVRRPIFSQRESNSTLYKVDADTNIAKRTQVRLGEGSNDQIQIIEGLTVGDRIIISDASSWQKYQTVRIN